MFPRFRKSFRGEVAAHPGPAKPPLVPDDLGKSILASTISFPPPPDMYVPKRYKRPRRTDILACDTFVSRGDAKLIRPDLQVLAEIQKSEPRVRYFGIAGTEAFRESPEGKLHEPELYDTIIRPLAKQITQDFPDRKLGLRGIKTSINGAVYVDSAMTILDIEDVVDAGEEQLKGWFRAGGFFPDDDYTPIHHRVAQYVADTDLFRDNVEDGSGRSEAIFPAILVYDPDQLTFGQRYHTGFKNPDHPTEAVLAAYVLDCQV